MVGELVDPTKLTIGVFFGLVTSKDKVRLQRRIEKGSSVLPGKSFQGDWELPGGGAKEKDLRKVLTLSGLFIEGEREAWEELGVKRVHMPAPDLPFYRAVFFSEKTRKTDWAFMFAIPPDCWNEAALMKRETIDVSPVEIRELANRPEGDRLLSGWGKRMCRMSLASFLMITVRDIQNAVTAIDYLSEINPHWSEQELFRCPEASLDQFRRELNLE